MSITKSNLHIIICDYVPLYEYRGEVFSYNDFWKNKCIKKIKESGNNLSEDQV